MSQWIAKDKRQYDQIESNELKSGSSEDEAAEIAAGTVSKHRRREERPQNTTTQGTGNSKKRFNDRTVAELRNLAADANIAGRSRMRKPELIAALGGG